MSRPFAFRPHEHLRRPADFKRVYDRRRSASDAWLLVYACENDLPYSRLGLSVSSKFGGAVQRNLLRRLYREAYRLTKAGIPPGLDLVLIPRRPEPPSLDALKQVLPKLVRQAAKRLARDGEQA
jgi:ribonuclease P protein component